MNRHDEIQGMARDVASNVHADPAARDAMADGLIKLIGLMLKAQGKYLACEGEAGLNDAHSFDPAQQAANCTPEQIAEMQSEAIQDMVKYHGMYLTGEQMQDCAGQLVEECTNPRVDLDRWRQVTGYEWCVCGHHPDSHQDAVCIGEQHNKHACEGGPCPGFRAKEPTGGWVHVDRRPEPLRSAPEGCGQCTQFTPCPDPQPGCYVTPPQV